MNESQKESQEKFKKDSLKGSRLEFMKEFWEKSMKESRQKSPIELGWIQ